MDWKTLLNENLRKHLYFQLGEVNKNSKAFSKAKEPNRAQLWVAVANLSQLVSALNIRIKELECKLDGDVLKKKVKKKSQKRKISMI